MYRAIPAVVLGLIVIGVASGLMSPKAPTAAFECPVAQPATTAMAIEETPAQLQSVTEALKGPELENAILGMARALKSKNPNADTADLVNYFLTAYCPLVDKESGLDDSEKRDRMDRFSSQLFQILTPQE